MRERQTIGALIPWRWAIILSALGLAQGCDGASADKNAPSRLTLEQLKDPETCKGCHERHYREWRSSMHAYAANDPLFLAMNARGQAEGAVGDLCVKCHAPMAVLEGWTDYGNVEELPQRSKGVTCYYCHSVQGVGEEHNNALQVSASNETLFGPYADPHESAPHQAEHSPFLDGRTPESSAMCGSCHDITLPSGVHLERTYREWQESALNTQSCARGCHMRGRNDTAVSGPLAPPLVPARRVSAGEGVHEHLFAGVDTVLTPWAEDDPALLEVQRAAIDCELEDALQFTEICLNPGAGGFDVGLTLEAVGVGHAWPSGSAQDRRAWVELRAFEGGQLVFESAVQPGESLDDASRDRSRQLAVLRDYIYGADEREVHMFWEAAPSARYPLGYQSTTIPTGVNHTLRMTYSLFGAQPDRIEAVVKLRPIGADVLQDLYESGYSSPDEQLEASTITLERTRISWAPGRANECRKNPDVARVPVDCHAAYAELLTR